MTMYWLFVCGQREIYWNGWVRLTLVQKKSNRSILSSHSFERFSCMLTNTDILIVCVEILISLLCAVCGVWCVLFTYRKKRNISNNRFCSTRSSCMYCEPWQAEQVRRQSSLSREIIILFPSFAHCLSRLKNLFRNYFVYISFNNYQRHCLSTWPNVFESKTTVLQWSKQRKRISNWTIQFSDKWQAIPHGPALSRQSAEPSQYFFLELITGVFDRVSNFIVIIRLAIECDVFSIQFRRIYQ